MGFVLLTGSIQSRISWVISLVLLYSSLSCSVFYRLYLRELDFPRRTDHCFYMSPFAKMAVRLILEKMAYSTTKTRAGEKSLLESQHALI